jgi:hypothetical protein
VTHPTVTWRRRPTTELVVITGKSFTGNLRIFSLPLPVKFLPVTSKLKGFKLYHFTRFYLKLARKTPVFTPKLQGFILIRQMF